MTLGVPWAHMIKARLSNLQRSYFVHTDFDKHWHLTPWQLPPNHTLIDEAVALQEPAIRVTKRSAPTASSGRIYSGFEIAEKAAKRARTGKKEQSSTQAVLSTSHHHARAYVSAPGTFQHFPALVPLF